MKKLYALLVGINDYKTPISPLNGCVQDVQKIEKYLKTQHENQFQLNILKLINEEATYAQIIKGFRDHLAKASEEDIVWFHFSGHGSEEPTATEFLSIEENGKDQTLLCVDSLPEQSYNLADKELAVLLNEVSTKFPTGESKEKPPHIVVSLDCCHSGSGTRDAGQMEEIKVRSARSADRDRPIDSYANGFYTQQGEQLQVPSCPHVLLSACQSFEYAGDLKDGGAFTTGLINALKASKGQINYADLFIRARASVQNVRKNQTPYFSSINNFNPYSLFLEGTEFGSPDFFEVFFEKGKWHVKCGAIHGLPTDQGSNIEIDIYSFPAKKLKGSATIDSVGAQQSVLNMDMKFQLKSTLDGIIPGEDHYRGVIKSFPIPAEKIYLHGNGQIIKTLIKDQPDSNYFEMIESSDQGHQIEVEIGDEYIITDLIKNKIVHKTNDQQELYVALYRMVKWYRFLNLENKNLKSGLKKRVDLKLKVHDTQGNIEDYITEEIKLFASEENSMGGKFGFLPKAVIKDGSQNLYFYLMYLRENYAIECPDEEVPFLTNEHDSKQLELSLWKEIKGFGPDPDQNSVTSFFKLIVTTEPLDFFQFLQTGLGVTRSELSTWNPSKISNDWAVYDIAVTICRQEQKINANSLVSFNDGALKIFPHSSLKADLSLSKEGVKTRNANSFGNATLMENKQFKLVNLNNTRSHEASNILELNNINLSDYSKLQSNPLELQLAMESADDEMILPMAFDGKHYRLVGESEANEGGTLVKINKLPEPSELSTNTDVAMGNRSAFSSLKIAFFKIVLKQDVKNKLSLIENNNGSYQLTKDNFAVKLMSAKKILLVVHGLFSDSLSTIEQLQVLNQSKFDEYDCILGYDYDCITVPLDQSAKALKKDLMDLNIHSHEDKTIDVLAHSCGGLVTRWLIEQEGGAAYIKQLIMLGTPNAGSLYGKIEGYRTFSLQLLELAANFIPNIVPGVGIAIKVLKYAGNLTPSLKQMSPDSDFLNKLNTSKDPAIPYTIIAAVSTGTEEKSPALNAMQKLFKNKVQDNDKDIDHDLFVKPESVYLEAIFNNRSTPAKLQARLSGHHFSFLKDVDLN